MSALLDRFGRPTVPKRHAREIVVAPRLPKFIRDRYTGNPFTSDGDVVLDCDVTGCGWHAMGPRKEAKARWKEHYRQFHQQDNTIGVVLLNAPRQ